MGRSFLYITFMYGLVLVIAYIPQMIASIDYVKAWLDNTEHFKVLYIDFSSIFVILMVTLLLIFAGFIGTYTSNSKEFIPIYLVIAIIIFAVSMVFFYFGITISVIFHPDIIPILLSSIIGVIGSFVVSCFIQPYCYGRMKYVRSEFRKTMD